MSEAFTLNVKAREDIGKGASRRQRRLTGEIPGIIYGGKKKPEMISIPHKDIVKALENEAFYSHIVTLDVDGKAQEVILKDLQRHPAKALILHADFMRVSKSKKLTINAPIHFINEDTCVGVKVQGGSISHNMTELEVSCLPKDLPEFIEVDLAEVEIGQIVHISDIKLPKGVESVALSHGEAHDQSVATVNKARGEEVEVEGEVEGEGEESTEEAGEE